MLGTGRKSNIRRHLLRVKVQNELSSVHTGGEHVSPVFLGQLDARAPVEAVLNLLRRQLPCRKFSSIKGYIHTSKSLSSCSSRSSYRYHPRQTAETPLISLRPGHLACCSVSAAPGVDLTVLCVAAPELLSSVSAQLSQHALVEPLCVCVCMCPVCRHLAYTTTHTHRHPLLPFSPPQLRLPNSASLPPLLSSSLTYIGASVCTQARALPEVNSSTKTATTTATFSNISFYLFRVTM